MALTATITLSSQAEGASMLEHITQGKRLLAGAERAFLSASSVRIKGYSREGGVVSELNLSALSNGDGSYLTRIGTATLETIVLGGAAYQYANQQFLALEQETSSQPVGVANSWIEGGSLWAADLSAQFSFGAILRDLAHFGTRPVLMGDRRIDGVAVAEIRSSAGDLYVARSSPPYPVELQFYGKSSREVLHLSGWNSQAEPTPPSTAAPAGIDLSDRWSGYVVPTTFGSTSAVSAEWVEPTANCSATPNSTSALWVGIDGQDNGQVLQVGTEVDCEQGEQADYVWFENFPGPVQVRSYAVRAGVSIRANLNEIRPGYWNYSLADLATGQIWSNPTPVPYSGPDTSVEWIVEDPGKVAGPLTDFGAVTFSNISVNDIVPTMDVHDNGLAMFRSGRFLDNISQYADDSFEVVYH